MMAASDDDSKKIIMIAVDGSEQAEHAFDCKYFTINPCRNVPLDTPLLLSFFTDLAIVDRRESVTVKLVGAAYILCKRYTD